MRVTGLRLTNFKRFADLTVQEVPDSARLVMMVGPNGCGKSSIFDAFSVFYHSRGGFGLNQDAIYYARESEETVSLLERVEVAVRGQERATTVKGMFYFRSAYRNDPEFALNSLERLGDTVEDVRVRRMIEADASVSRNFQRLASRAFEDVFEREQGHTTIDQFRERVIGQLRDSMLRLFPDLQLNSLGNPLEQGTFRFTKGSAAGFRYMNLSGGEKAAFDLILDLIVRRHAYPEAIYCIDEPDAHMSTRLQGALLSGLLELVPEPGQLWVSTHSIGMMRKARELAAARPESVAFLDFWDRDFDRPVVMRPTKPTRLFWERALHVALDDLASLVAPSEVWICEGNPRGPVPGKNVEHDARCYNEIFAEEMPDVKFISGGNSREVSGDRLGLVYALPSVAQGIAVRRLIDGDDHSPAQIADLARQGITVLDRRHIESFLYDDEILEALCRSLGREADIPGVLADKVQSLASLQLRNRPSDDIKAAAGQIYDAIRASAQCEGSRQ